MAIGVVSAATRAGGGEVRVHRRSLTDSRYALGFEKSDEVPHGECVIRLPIT